MSDEVKLLTYTAETISPVYDGILQELFTSGGGVITGGVVTIKDANTLHISDGYGALCGREFKIFASDIPVTLSSSGTLNGRLYLHMDLSQLTNPLQLLVETGASLTPVQQDSNVNTTNGVYEINLATFSVGTSTISNLVSVAPTLKTLRAKTLQSVNDCGLSTDANDIAGAAALSELNSALGKKLWENNSPSSAFAAQNIQLSSSDYDYLTFFYISTNADTRFIHSEDVLKGKSFTAEDFIFSGGGTTPTMRMRDYTYSSDTVYSIGAGSVATSGSGSSANNGVCVPLAIYGRKFGN